MINYNISGTHGLLKSLKFILNVDINPPSHNISFTSIEAPQLFSNISFESIDASSISGTASFFNRGSLNISQNTLFNFDGVSQPIRLNSSLLYCNTASIGEGSGNESSSIGGFLSSSQIQVSEIAQGTVNILIPIKWAHPTVDNIGDTTIGDIVLVINGNTININQKLLDIPNGEFSVINASFDSGLLISGNNTIQIFADFNSSGVSIHYKLDTDNGLYAELYVPTNVKYDINNFGSYSDIPAYIEVYNPKLSFTDIPAILDVYKPSDIPGSIIVEAVGLEHLPGTILVVNQYVHYLPGQMISTTPVDLLASISVSVSANADIEGILIVPIEADISGSILVSAPSDILSDILVVGPSTIPSELIVVRPSDIPGNISISKPTDDISGELITVRPRDILAEISISASYETTIPAEMAVERPSEDLLAELIITHQEYSYLSGTLVVYRTASSDIPAFIEVIDKLLEEDIPASLTVIRPSSDLSVKVIVSAPGFDQIEGKLLVWKPVDIAGTITVGKPESHISGTITIKPYSDLLGHLSVDRQNKDLQGILNVNNFGFDESLSGSVLVDKNHSQIDARLVIGGAINSIAGSLQVYIPIFNDFSTIKGAIMVTYPQQYVSIPATVRVQDYSDLQGSIVVQREYSDILGTITTLEKFQGNIGLESVYTYSRFYTNIKDLTIISGSVSDNLTIEPSDELVFDLLPVMTYSGTEPISIVSIQDELDWMAYNSRSLEWGLPIQITDNQSINNDLSNPNISIYDDKIFVTYAQNYKNQIKRIHVVKTDNPDITPEEQWRASKIENNAYMSQFIGNSGEMIIGTQNGWIHIESPQTNDSNDFYTSKIEFTPESYEYLNINVSATTDKNTSVQLQKNIWDTILYQMQREGLIEYPPQQWAKDGETLISEKINAPMDYMDPVPKSKNFIPSGTIGYYQDFNNIFAGNGG